MLPRISESCIAKNKFCLPTKKNTNCRYLLLNTTIIPLYNGEV